MSWPPTTAGGIKRRLGSDCAECHVAHSLTAGPAWHYRNRYSTGFWSSYRSRDSQPAVALG